VTGSRADYGLLEPIIDRISKEFEMILVSCGKHEVKYPHISVKMDMNDSCKSIVNAMGNEMVEFSNIYSKYKPDILMVLGDRYEIIIPVLVANIFRIPVGHLCGGDITEGAFDDNLRHAITKMSHLHFVTNEISKSIISKMGECDEYIYVVGNSGLYEIMNFLPMKKKDVEMELSMNFNINNIVVLYNPVTLEVDHSRIEIDNILKSINNLENANIYFILPNLDPDNEYIKKVIIEFCNKSKNRKYYGTLGRKLYLNLLYYSDVLIGNSSSGIYEAPLFKKTVINVGNRQKGRLMASNVINVSGDSVFDVKYKFSKFEYPYVLKNSADEIINILKSVDLKTLIPKKFHKN